MVYADLFRCLYISRINNINNTQYDFVHPGRKQVGNVNMDETSRLKPFDYDFKFLHEIKTFLTKIIVKYSSGDLQWSDKELSEGVYSKLSDGREVRIVLPRERTETASLFKDVVDSKKHECDSETNQLHFVGFIGFSRPREILSDRLVKDLWDLDGELIGELPRQKHIIAYISAERTRGGHWGNLVLFDSPEAVTQWRDYQYHSKAIVEISPQVYTHIRIHRGTLPSGFSSEKFRVTQTIFLDYGPECVGQFVSRKVEVWATHESTSYFETEK